MKIVGDENGTVIFWPYGYMRINQSSYYLITANFQHFLDIWYRVSTVSTKSSYYSTNANIKQKAKIKTCDKEN